MCLFTYCSLSFAVPADCLSNVDSKNKDSTKEEKPEEKPPNIGNYALPTSQQFAPLISFGQRLVGKDVTQLSLFADDRVGHHQNYIDSELFIDYGISDNLAVGLDVPYASSFKYENTYSTGIQDIILQGEYAFLNVSTKTYSDQATIVVNLSFPTGSANNQPSTGFGALSFFTGLTSIRMYTDWYLFTSHGIEVRTERHATRFGNSFLYQFGLGRNISYIPNKMIFSWLLELDGTYSDRNKIQGFVDPNSGGNLIYLTPSLWLSLQKFYVQFGVSWALSQHLLGVQNKYTYSVAGNLVWTF